jgi:hypothetical protein
MNDLDELLSRPLADVADDGFSHSVMTRILAEQRRRDAIAWMAAAACALLVLPFLPLHEIAVMLGQAVPQAIGSELSQAAARLTASWAAQLALAVLVLTFVLERQLSRP